MLRAILGFFQTKSAKDRNFSLKKYILLVLESENLYVSAFLIRAV